MVSINFLNIQPLFNYRQRTNDHEINFSHCVNDTPSGARSKFFQWGPIRRFLNCHILLSLILVN